MAKSSTVNLQRLTHASLGVASLIFGGWQAVDMIQHGFLGHMEPSFASMSTIVHTLCAVAGTSRLEFDIPRERVRNNLIWPSVFANLWFGLSCLTEWALVSSDGSSGGITDAGFLFSMFDNHIWQAFSVIVCASTVWQVCEVMQIDQHYENVARSRSKKNRNTSTAPSSEFPNDENSGNAMTVTTGYVRDSLWYENPILNGLGAYFSFLGWIQVAMVPYLLVSCFVDPTDYATFVSQYDGFGDIIRNIHINFMAVNNVAIFAASLFRYKAITNNNYVFLPVIVTNFIAAGAVIQALSTLGDGNFLEQLLVLVQNGISSHHTFPIM